jgi:hypothetical protein
VCVLSRGHWDGYLAWDASIPREDRALLEPVARERIAELQSRLRLRLREVGVAGRRTPDGWRLLFDVDPC